MLLSLGCLQLILNLAYFLDVIYLADLFNPVSDPGCPCQWLQGNLSQFNVPLLLGADLGYYFQCGAILA